MPSKTSTTATTLKADGIVVGMIVLFATTVLQRLLGLARGVLFCRFMDDQTLGRWALALGFLTMVTPLLLWGLPGSMGRFVEHFRRQGRLLEYLKGITLVTGLSIGLTAGLIIAFPSLTTTWIFREPMAQEVALAISIALLGVVVMNCTNDLLSALRQVRTVSIIQFVFSIVFTFVGTGWLLWGGGFAGLIAVYGLSSLIAAVPGIFQVLRHRQSLMPPALLLAKLPKGLGPFRSNGLWDRVLPFAATVWLMNLLVNAFELTDRCMLLYLFPGGAEAGQAAVGQYHSSRILPALLMSLATLVGGVLMPYLSADWEAGFVRRVAYRCKQSLMGVSLAFTLIGALTLWVAPWLFDRVMGGRYQEGLDVLPATFVMCAWGALAMLAQNYLWCAEKGRQLSFMLVFALTTNLVFNAIFVPLWGLSGAVLATLIANLILLCGLWWILRRVGFPLDQTSVWCTVLPGTLLAGPWVALIAVVLTSLVSPHIQRWLGQVVTGVVRYNAFRLTRQAI